LPGGFGGCGFWAMGPGVFVVQICGKLLSKHLILFRMMACQHGGFKKRVLNLLRQPAPGVDDGLAERQGKSGVLAHGVTTPGATLSSTRASVPNPKSARLLGGHFANFAFKATLES